MLFESCVDSVAAAVASAAGGAGRIELCANLDVGGTTPPVALVARAVADTRVPVFAMVRPRGGHFVYSRAEALAMLRDVRAMADAGANGIVVGALTIDRTIDRPLMERLVEAARPLPVTCHKAFDDTVDLVAALDVLLSLGVDRVLTSGGVATAAAGAHVIAELVRHAGDALVVVAGGGVRAANVVDVVRATGVREVHAKLLPTGPVGLDLAESTAVVATFVRAMSAAST